MQLHKISLLALVGLLLATDTSMAASDGAAGGAGARARRISSIEREEMEAAIKASEESAVADKTRRLADRTRSEEELAAAMAASTADAARPRTPDVGYGAPSRRGRSASPSIKAFREAMDASRVTAAEEEAARAHRAALSTRRDATVAARVESQHSSDNWINPTYIRDHLDALVADKVAYQAIISTNLSIEEKIAREGEFGKGGGAFEVGYRRAKLLRVIAKLEHPSGGAAARY